jgi:hypothetical protein
MLLKTVLAAPADGEGAYHSLRRVRRTDRRQPTHRCHDMLDPVPETQLECEESGAKPGACTPSVSEEEAQQTGIGYGTP